MLREEALNLLDLQVRDWAQQLHSRNWRIQQTSTRRCMQCWPATRMKLPAGCHRSCSQNAAAYPARLMWQPVTVTLPLCQVCILMTLCRDTDATLFAPVSSPLELCKLNALVSSNINTLLVQLSSIKPWVQVHAKPSLRTEELSRSFMSHHKQA